MSDTPDIVESLSGPHEWGYRDCADGTFIEDLSPFEAAAALTALREALAWYGEQARLARLVHNGGDTGRHALAKDGGERARAALASEDGE